MAYGTVKVDTIIFDQGGADQNVTVSGIYRAITSGVTVSGTISGAVLVGTTTVSGATVTGTTANFVSGVFTTVVSGATVTGTQSSFTSGNFVTLSGATATFTSGVIASGTATNPSLSIVGDGNTGIYSPGADQVAVATNGTGRLFIDANGNVGVGVTPVDVAGFNSIQIGDTNGVFFDCFTGATHEARILSLPGDLRINQITSGSLGLYTNNTERLRITSAGLVGIGTSSPQAQLQVLDRIKISDSTQAQGSLQLGDGASTTFNVGLARWNGSTNVPGAAGLGYFSQGTGNSGGHYFYTGDAAAGSQTARMIIAPGGNVGIGTTSPGDKLDVLGIVRATNTTDSNFYSTFSNPDGLTRIRAYGGGSSICFDLGTSEKARIDSSGNVGIGTSGPQAVLDTRGTASSSIEIARIGNGTKYVGIGTDGANYGWIQSFASTALCLNPLGNNVGIGTTSPGSTLHVVGNQFLTGGNYFTDTTSGYFFNGSGGFAGGIFGSSSGNIANIVSPQTITLSTASSERARIDTSGRLLVGTSSYDGNARAVIQGNTSSNTTGALAVRYNGTRPTSAGEGIGAIRFESTSNTSSNYHYASINCDTDGTSSSDTDIPGRLVFSTTEDGASAPTERMRITSAGNVGIGTTSPSSPLQVVGEISSGAAGTNGSISLRRTSDGASINSIAYDSATEEMRLNNGSGNGRIVFQTVSTERARVDSSGRLLVGTSTARSTFYSTASAFIQIEGGAASGSESLAIVRNVNDIFGGSLILAKTRGAGDTIVTSGDTIGNVTWQGNDGSKFVQAARIEAQVDGTPGTNDMPGRLVFFTTADGQSTPTERMRIDSAGALKASTNGTYKFGTGIGEITHNDATSSVHLIASSTGFTGDAVTISTYRNTVNDSYKFLSCIRQGFAIALEIRDDGDVYNVNGTYGSLSDVKLKENIVDANSQWDDIRHLRVRNYNFKPETNNSTHKQIGVIAQEIEDVSPGLVNTVSDRDAEGNDLGTVTKSVNYSVLYMKAVKALQEAMTRIETLEADVALLKSA